MSELLVRRPEAARVLGVSERTLIRLSERGAVPVVRVGVRGVRYRVTDLHDFVDGLKAGVC